MKRQINDLLAKKMDRREFIKHVGVGTLVLFGFGSALKLLNGQAQQKNSNASGAKEQSMAYGASAYGGRVRS